MSRAKPVHDFSTGQLQNLRARRRDRLDVKMKIRECLCSGILNLDGTSNLASFSPSEMLKACVEWIPWEGLDKQIHQSLSVFSLGGTTAGHRANHFQRRWDRSWMLLLHKENGPSLCLRPGAFPLVTEDECLALRLDKKKLYKAPAKFDQLLMQRQFAGCHGSCCHRKLSTLLLLITTDVRMRHWG